VNGDDTPRVAAIEHFTASRRCPNEKPCRNGFVAANVVDLAEHRVHG
jgi:hypothetical protein